MNYLQILLILVLALATNGCAFHRENILQDAEYRLIGMSKSELLACAGEPSSIRQKDGKELLVYTNGKPSKERDSCTVAFTLEDGRISKFDFNGDLKGIKDPAESCYQIVRDCW